ncbi:hypothetical protein T492DRAFT_842512 [Pavlovales sp. CCMP2436]|nr:hypothetical protein T492DRAFT_842512 [Pavlovales sp. CCMP2436]
MRANRQGTSHLSWCPKVWPDLTRVPPWLARLKSLRHSFNKIHLLKQNPRANSMAASVPQRMDTQSPTAAYLLWMQYAHALYAPDTVPADRARASRWLEQAARDANALALCSSVLRCGLLGESPPAPGIPPAGAPALILAAQYSEVFVGFVGAFCATVRKRIRRDVLPPEAFAGLAGELARSTLVCADPAASGTIPRPLLAALALALASALVRSAAVPLAELVQHAAVQLRGAGPAGERALFALISCLPDELTNQMAASGEMRARIAQVRAALRGAGAASGVLAILSEWHALAAHARSDLYEEKTKHACAPTADERARALSALVEWLEARALSPVDVLESPLLHSAANALDLDAAARTAVTVNSNLGRGDESGDEDDTELSAEEEAIAMEAEGAVGCMCAIADALSADLAAAEPNSGNSEYAGARKGGGGDVGHLDSFGEGTESGGVLDGPEASLPAGALVDVRATAAAASALAEHVSAAAHILLQILSQIVEQTIMANPKLFAQHVSASAARGLRPGAGTRRSAALRSARNASIRRLYGGRPHYEAPGRPHYGVPETLAYDVYTEGGRITKRQVRPLILFVYDAEVGRIKERETEVSCIKERK